MAGGDGYPRIVVEPPGPRAREVLARDERVIMQSFTRWYPLVAKRGWGALVEDVDGNVYIDLNAGIAVLNAGHCHPRVVEAIRRQAERLLHYSLTDFYYEEAVVFAEKLLSLTPIRDGKVFFTNSGAESIEAVVKAARGYHRGSRPYIIAFTGSFHGRTYAAMSLTASKTVQRRWFHPLVPGVIHVPYPNPYRCPFYTDDPGECAERVLSYIEGEVFARLVDPEEVGLVILEPIQGEGGYVVPPDNFLPGLRRLTRRYGILLAVDEVQTGIGRTGRWFAVEHWGVEPDLMAVAKAVGGGLPLGAAVGRRDVMSLPRGSHANTFGGNPVSLAAGMAAIQVLEEGGYVERAARLGEEVVRHFRDLAGEAGLIGDVRGKGFMIGVELVRDRGTKEPAARELGEVVRRSFKRGVLAIGAGVSTLRISPPLTIEEDLLWRAVEIVSDVLREVSREAAANR